jgi:transposase
LAEQIGTDGYTLLAAVASPTTPADLQDLECLQLLKQVWEQQFILVEGEEESGTPAQEKRPRLRSNGELSPGAELIFSPYDPEVRYSAKRSTEWLGYKVHLTETCGAGAPRLITHVETTLATQQDVEAVEAIHQGLAEQGLLPKVHLVDTGYPAGDVLVSSQQQYGIDLFGPVRPDTSWQARAGQGFDLAHFLIDWEAHQARCPQRKTSQHWIPHQGRDGNLYIKIDFSPSDCLPCPVRALCTHSQTGARHLSALPQDLHLAVQAARQRQSTDDFKTRYRLRAGVEGTISQAAYARELRRARYRGLAKTHLQGIITAVAVNLTRTLAWLSGIPLALTRPSHFAALAA